MKGNSIVWMYAVATWLWFGSTSGIGNSFIKDTFIKQYPNGGGVFADGDESPMRIAGASGLCVEVRDGRYANGNPIDLGKCKSNSDVDQLWTFKSDGTIRSNGKCLTACYGLPGSYIMIYDCPLDGVTDDSSWQYSMDYGTIMNPASGLVLTATSGEKGAALVLDVNSYALGQAWLHSNHTKPYETSIYTLNDFFLTHSDIKYIICNQSLGKVWVEKSTDGHDKQRWSLYNDGSIRPTQNNDTCLTGDANVKNGIVRVLDCNVRSSGQRWLWNNDLSVLNLQYGLVLTVKDSDPSLKEIVIRPFTGEPNQQWHHFIGI